MDMNSLKSDHVPHVSLLHYHSSHLLISVLILLPVDVPFNSSFPLPYRIEYKWRGTKDEDRPLGVMTLFMISLVLFVGIVSVAYTTYDRGDPQRPRKGPSSGGGSGSATYVGGGAGIHVKRRPSGGGSSYDKRGKY
jgi:hypothetical protein